MLYANILSEHFHHSGSYTDMGSLLFQIGLGHMTDDSTVIGQAVVTNLAGLSATNPIKGYDMSCSALPTMYNAILIRPYSYELMGRR